MTHAALHTRICDLFGIKYPIVQTGMGWVAGPSLCSATSNAGGLGILAAATMSFEELERNIAEVKTRTSNPFGVNLRADAVDAMDRVQLLIREKVKVASFAQAPRKDLISALKDEGVLVVPSIGARRHAEKVAEWGVDAVLAQGGEGGGHVGQVPTTLLLPQVVDAVDIPVIAAGGFFDGRGLVAALSYGAEGIAMGTRFLLTSDSRVPELVKGEYLKRAVTDTVVTREVDGQAHRVLNTEFIDKLEHQVPGTGFITALRNGLKFRKESGLSLLDMLREGRAMRKSQDLSWSQVVMAANTVMFLKRALVEGRTDIGVFPTGQVVGVIEDLPSCQELIDRIIGEADKVLTRLNG
jgi:NAD(P)H-dependent flavin oxidoreductase YrpB (nitropropane dioxygenase family)